MKKDFLIIFLIIYTFNNSYSQDFQGIAFYESKTSVDSNFGPPDMPEGRKQEMLARIKKAMEKTFKLNFNKTASFYEEEERLEAPSANGGGMRFGFGGSTGEYYKDIQNQEYRNKTEMFGKVFLIIDSLKQWEWKLGSETKKIGNYTCYKATAINKDTTLANGFRDMFRRDREKANQEKDSTTTKNSILPEIEKQEQIITAWFTPEIPISQGPSSYWGLPGLILEVNDGKTAILCSKIILNPEEKFSINAPSKGKEVTQNEYNEIMSKKMKEMSERFRSNRNRQQGPPPRN